MTECIQHSTVGQLVHFRLCASVTHFFVVIKRIKLILHGISYNQYCPRNKPYYKIWHLECDSNAPYVTHKTTRTRDNIKDILQFHERTHRQWNHSCFHHNIYSF